jgi:tetratricopeptide (TPR) repeat protein
MGLRDFLRRRRAEALTRRGYHAIRSRAYDDAIATARRLRDLGYSSAFEIEALAHAEQGDLTRAISVLEDGVRIAPAVWVNWQLLGNYLSDAGRYLDADVAYSNALTCPDVWTASVFLNRSLVADRREDYAQALAHLDKAGTLAPDMVLMAEGVRVRALWKTGRAQEAERRASTALERDSEAGGSRSWGLLAADLVHIRLELGHDRTTVAAFASQACQRAKDCPELLEAARGVGISV